MSPALTPRSFLFAAALALCLPLAPALAASSPVLALPTVHPESKLIGSGSARALLLESLAVRHDPGIRIRISCTGCSRLSSPRARETYPNRDLTRYLGLNWLIRPGRRVEVLALEPKAVGRYLLLGVRAPLSAHSFGVRASGCINGSRQRINCPATEVPNPLPSPGERLFEETVGGDTHTFTDYHNASGEGPLIGAGQTVGVSCRVEGLVVEDGDVWWYRIASSPWSDQYYASADPFYNNGQRTGPLQDTPFYDPQVPTC